MSPDGYFYSKVMIFLLNPLSKTDNWEVFDLNLNYIN